MPASLLVSFCVICVPLCLRIPVADSVNYDEERLIRWLREARRVLAFCGAGVSAESGVPTFRGAGGLWEGQPVEEVATPEGFARDPGKVWRFYGERMQGVGSVHPNPAHRVLRAMEEHYDDFLLVTQNVDDLHERAGSRKLVKLHGSLLETRCIVCEAVEPLAEPVQMEPLHAGVLPYCGCGGMLRPNVVWFGEALDPAHFDRIRAFFAQAQFDDTPSVVLVIGTSGMVSSGYGIPQNARYFGARSVEINPEPAFECSVDLVFESRAGELLGRLWPQVLESG
jgi:NAD-dependent deacetylase